MAEVFRHIIDAHEWRRFADSRRALAAGTLDDAVAAQLDEIAPGWRQDGHRRKLNLSLVAVLDFWDRHGRAPKRCDMVAGQDLGVVMGNYRQREKRGALPVEAVALLDQVRPDWRTARAIDAASMAARTRVKPSR